MATTNVTSGTRVSVNKMWPTAHMFQLILEDSEISIYRYMERKTNNLFGDSINNANEITGTN